MERKKRQNAEDERIYIRLRRSAVSHGQILLRILFKKMSENVFSVYFRKKYKHIHLIRNGSLL